MFGSIAVLFVLPWLDTSRVRSAAFRPIYRQFFWIFVLVGIGLGYLGAQPAEGGYVIAARILTVYYFAPLPHHPAAARADREAEAAAGEHHRSGARASRGARRRASRA